MVLTCCICIIHVAHLAIQRSQVSHPKSTQTVTASNAAPRCYQLWLIWLWVFNLLNQLGWIFGTQRSHGGKSKSGNGILDYIGWTWFVFLYDLSFGTLRFNNLRVHLFALFIIIDYNNDTQIWSTAVRHQTLSFSKQGFRPLIYFFICFYRLQISQPIQTFCLSNYSKEQYYLYRLLLFFLEVWKGPKPNRSHLINDIISGIWMHMADPCAAIPVGSSQVSVSENPVFVMAEGRVYNFSAGPSAMPLEVPGFPMDWYGLHGLWLISRFQATNQL